MTNRSRQIVELAAKQTKDSFARSWLLADERGTFEKAASRYLEQTTDKARELKLSIDKVNEEIATILALSAIEAQLKRKRR
jgi:hypothetical protein